MTDNKFIVVAIDGGAASGKSSTSKILSERLDLMYVNTGSHYRSITWAILEGEVDFNNESAIIEFLKTLPIGHIIEGKEAKITLKEQPFGDEIRSEAVNNAVSIVAAIPSVRQYLLDHQRSYRNLAKNAGFKGLIMEGRDIGSVIFPNADFRFFLTADESERARRRQLEGQVDSIQKRDQLDKTRKTAPLTCADGATTVETTHLSLLEVAEKLQIIIHSGKDT